MTFLRSTDDIKVSRPVRTQPFALTAAHLSPCAHSNVCRVLRASLTLKHHSPHALCPAGPSSAPPARAYTCALLVPLRLLCKRFRSVLTTLGVADVDLWPHLYVRDGVVSTDPLSSRVAAVCRSNFGPGVVSGHVASVLPMVSNACLCYSSV